MSDAPFALAISAGILAAVNPCGFALLPAYMSLLITDPGGRDTTVGWPTRLKRALALTAVMTLGFITVFGAFGLLAAPAADWLAARLPWLTVVIGVALVLLGLWLLAGRELPSPVPKPGRAPQLRQRFWPMYAFGLSFAVASLGCTIGPFLAVVVTSFTANTTTGIALFLSYAAGMALVVGTVAVAVAAAQQTVILWIRRAAPILSRIAGALLAIAGAYVAWYGWYEIRINANATTTDSIIDTAATFQTWLTIATERIGAPGLLVILVAVTAAVSIIVRRQRAR